MLIAASSCNSPYPASDELANTLYTTFADEPKHLDPARAYGGVPYQLICNILEPPFQYHFLKRPYGLEPRSAVAVPEPETREVPWKGKTIQATVYTIQIKKDIRYQDHPCFVPANRCLASRDMRGIWRVADFGKLAWRKVRPADFVFAIQRLADPRLTCPIIDSLKQNVLGLADYHEALQEALDAERARRRKAGGALYNREQDEKYNPIRLDYAAPPFPGARVTGAHSFEIVLEHPYPQILFWMAMPFFAPVPPEALEFFEQRPLLERSIVFDKNPVGSGPYLLAEFDPTNQLVLERNPNFRGERYPDLPAPEPTDAKAVAHYKALEAAGMLDDVGRPIPMVDRLVFRREVEWNPRWTKFRQGYYDTSGISSDTFDQSITLTSKGDAVLSDEMAARGIRLVTAPTPVVLFFAFNMTDGVVGGATPERRKLRQAISMAFNTEEHIAIFRNGRGTVAHSPTPPGIYGYEGGEAGMNPVTHRWDAARGRAVRRPLDEARQLLAEAGYPKGFGPDGQQLVLHFDNGWKSPDMRPRLKFVIKQFAKLGIRLVSRTTDYNGLQRKVRSNSYQILSWGWMADYPDPENFLFLLYGKNANSRGGDANLANYVRPEFDALFVKMRNMDNGPERRAVVRRMNRLLQEDVPWFGTEHPVSFSLVHDWYKNAYPNVMAANRLKYVRLDVGQRARGRRAWNHPNWVPVAVALTVFILFAIPAIRVAVRHLKEA